MMPEAFVTLLGTLAIAKQRELDEEAFEVYYAGLRDIPLPTLQAAIGVLIQRDSPYLPSVGEIRGACDRQRPRHTTLIGDQIRALLPAAAGLPDDDPRVWYACVTCRDSGWAEHWCPGPGHAPMPPFGFVREEYCTRCRGMGPTYPGHGFGVRCVCVATNPVIQRRREVRRRYAKGEAA